MRIDQGTAVVSKARPFAVSMSDNPKHGEHTLSTCPFSEIRGFSCGIFNIGTSAKLDIGKTKGNIVDIGNRIDCLIQGIDPAALPAHAPVRMYITISDNVFLIP